ncbi:DUF5689 domain-containing protein [Aquimarina algicola]|uniref:DUF5689 domain-containing protein n=1 Tax=Aquimarina algicola TaxID=2589995 RepID=A0A504JIZ5_9FLAO|nr:DUF5689 domain-containing protein [Aquimarina algicola]TPN87818.1 hypothetical protein FHK87_09600 [Aquimarina algicola]
MNTIIKIACVCTIAIITLKCSPEEDFKIPELEVVDPQIEGTIITIDALQGLLKQEQEKEGENAKVHFIETNSYVEGYVISSDKAGNFFKELLLQDQKKNPTSGIRVLIDETPLYTTYEFGQKVYIALDGLSIGVENGIPTLGIINRNSIGAIPSFMKDEVIIKTSEVAEITPREIRLEDIGDNLLNLYVTINEVQFHKSLVLENNIFTFAAEANDVFDGERIVESCHTGRTTILSTSTFSDFRGLKLPKTKGNFEGIVTKNFLGNRYNLVLNDPEGLNFNEDTRCDPIVLDCEEALTKGETILFEEDFTGLKSSDFEDQGWININLSGGKLKYKIGEFGGEQYAQITGFRSKESLYEAWLITPEIDVTTSTEEILQFDLQSGYDNGNILEVFVTENYTGDMMTTTWVKLNTTIPRAPLNGFGKFTSSGSISLTCLQGSIRVGFKYTGGDPRATTRYHIDNIKIIAK